MRKSVPVAVGLVLLILAGWLWLAARSEAQQSLPERVPNQGTIVPILGPAVDSVHRVVCYVFPNGSGDCEKF